MKYSTVLSDEELHTLCLCYPYKEMVTGFKKLSKEFSALLPGHRPQRMTEEAGRNLIANNLHSSLTMKMVEGLLVSWVPTISTFVNDIVADGKNEDYAYILAFSKLGIPSFVKIYFHIINKDFSDDRVHAISAGVEALSAERENIKKQQESTHTAKEISELIRQHEKNLRDKDQEIRSITKELSREQETTAALMEENKRIASLQSQLSEATLEIDRLQRELTSSAAQLAEMQAAYEESQCRSQEHSNHNAILQSKLDELQSLLSKQEEYRMSILKLIYNDTAEELRPHDMEEFNEYLSYNLTSIGLNKVKPYFHLLQSFLDDILFINRPIICNQSAGHALAQCISNSLCGHHSVTVLPYTRDITIQDIRSTLETDERILIFDSFIGNFNEKELLPLLRSVKRKIIFITAEYDKTITYLMPEEVLCSCTYINVSRIPEFLAANGTDEDPSTVKEELSVPLYEPVDVRAQRLCKGILSELGFSVTVTDSLSARMKNEQTVDAYLAFSILPYFCEANDISPYSISDRLGKYAGFSGKCAHKDLLLEWYGDG